MQSTYGSQFRSNSDEIKHYIKKLLADGKPHLRKDIMSYVQKQTSNTSYTDGQWAGSFMAISKMEGYTTPKTGVYQYVGDTLEQPISVMNDQVVSILNRCKAILETTVKSIKDEINKADLLKKNVLDLTSEEFEQLQVLRNLVQQIEDIKDGLN